MTRTISIAFASAAALLVAGCGETPAPPAAASTCAALRPDLPVKYHATTMDAVSIANVRRANARFRSACPEGGH